MFLIRLWVLSLFVCLAVCLAAWVPRSPRLPPTEVEEFLEHIESAAMENEYLQSCKLKQPDLDINKIVKELQACSHAPALKYVDWIGSGSGSLGSDKELDLLKTIFSGRSTPTRHEVALVQRTVKTGCELVQNFWKCVQPVFHYVREECVVNADLELKTMQHFDVYIGAICKNGGDRLIDFYTTQGGECVEHYKNYGGDGCNMYRLQKHAQYLKTNRATNAKNDKLLPTFCELSTDVQACLSKVIDTCPLEAPTKALKSILADVQSAWTTDYCLFGILPAGGSASAAAAAAAAAAVIGRNFYAIFASIFVLCASLKFRF